MATPSNLLLILRHGTAEQAEPKNLSEDGRAEADFAAQGLAAYLDLPGKFSPKASGSPRNTRILHSDKARAAQTAGAIADALKSAGCTVEVEQREECSPNAEPALVEALLSAKPTPVTCVVGHLPHVQRLAEALGVVASADTVFTNAGGLLLEQQAADGKWALASLVKHKVSWWMEAPPPPQ